MEGRRVGMNQKPTFVSPVTNERAVLGGKRVQSNYFLLLPTGGEPTTEGPHKATTSGRIV